MMTAIFILLAILKQNPNGQRIKKTRYEKRVVKTEIFKEFKVIYRQIIISTNINRTKNKKNKKNDTKLLTKTISHANIGV